MTPRSLAARASRLPTILRTLRHLRADQALAQLQHALRGVGRPRRAGDPAPRLAIPTPATPFLPPPAHVKALSRDRFELLATPFELPVGSAWQGRSEGPLFTYHLHQHEYLRLDALDPARRLAVIQDWIRAHPSGVGWDPHPTGLRILAWGKLLTTPGALPDDVVAREALLRSLADQAETLSQQLEVRLQANHLLSNLICVVFAGLLVDSAESVGWRARSRLLERELAAQVRADGGHEERSAMYHSALLEGVLDLLNLCRAEPARVPPGLADVLVRTAAGMLGALVRLCHPDGRIALFADAAFDIAPEPAALVDYARRLGVPDLDGPAPGRAGSARLADSGYVRLAGGDWLLLASVAAPSPPHQPGHAHCDALAFELSIGPHRLVCDTGVFEYVPGERRRLSRATASHATLEIDGQEQAEIWAAHRVGGRPRVGVVAFGAAQAEATCRGWAAGQPLHRRIFRVSPDAVEIEDTLEGSARQVCSRIPIAPDWSVELRSAEAPGAWVAICRPGSEEAGPAALDVVAIDLPGVFSWRIEEGPVYPSFGRERRRSVLVGRADGQPIERARMRFRRERGERGER